MVPELGCNSVSPLFGLVVPDPEWRTRIHNSIVQLGSPKIFSMRSYSEEQLRHSAIWHTVDDVLAAIEMSREKQP